MTEQDQRGKNLPAVPDKIIVAPIANDASLLAKAGFTDRLPVLMRDLNTVLGRAGIGYKLKDEPTVLSYTLETNTLAPTLKRNVKYESGPKVSMHVFPQEVVFSPDSKSHSARTILEITGGTGEDESITSAFLADLQDFIRETFPGKKAILQIEYKEKVEGVETAKGEPVYAERRKTVDFLSLTEDGVNELPLVIPRLENKPHVIIVEDIRGVSRLFLVTGLYLLDFYKGERVTDGVNVDATGNIIYEKQRRTFNVHKLIFDTQDFGASGADVEALLERFRQLAVKNPYFHMYPAQEKKLEEEGLI